MQNIDWGSALTQGTYDTFIFALPNGPVIDVFRVQRGVPTFVGMYLAASGKGSLYLTHDGKTMMLIGGGKVQVWNISEEQGVRAAALDKLSADELFMMACRSEVPKFVDKLTWLGLTGFSDGPPIFPCSDIR